MKARPYAWAVFTGVYALCCLGALASGVYNLFGLENRPVGIGMIVVALAIGGVTVLLVKRCWIELAKREYERTANLRTSSKQP